MRTNGEGIPVAALDIDGTLGDYHRHFLEFAEKWIGRPMPDPADINPGMRLHRFMRVPLATYRECKLAFRQSGLKRWMPVYPGAHSLTADLRRAGAEVWICTTRPYLRLDNIDPDTREWLRRAGILYDAVLFGEDKYEELKRQAGDRVALVLEDLPELWEKARRLLPDAVCFLRDQPYNRHLGQPTQHAFDWGTYSLRVRDLDDFRDTAVNAVDWWKERHAANTGAR